MVLQPLETAQIAHLDYSIYQLRIAIAISLAMHMSQDEIALHTIGTAVRLFNDQVGMAIDELPRLDSRSILNSLISLQTIDDFAVRYPLVIFQLTCTLGKPSISTIRKAVLAHPDCQYLYHFFVSPHFSNLGKNPVIRKRYSDLFGRTTLRRLGKGLYFSPLLQISIGHWFHLINSIRTSNLLYGECPPITIFMSELDSGHSLVQFINSSGIAVVTSEHVNSILSYPLKDAMTLYHSDYYLSAISPLTQTRLQDIFSSTHKNSKPQNEVVVHLRTPLYKYDSDSFHANLRNVSPDTYSAAISYLQENSHYRPILITADSVIQHSLPVPTIQVHDYQSEFRQWNAISKAPFSVGTASGLSHLFNLGGGHTLRSNSNGLALDDFFTDKHLIACKRFKLHAFTDIRLAKAELAYLICLPWEIECGLASIASITDLNDTELLSCVQEYLDIYHGIQSPNTLHKLLEQYGLSEFTKTVPNRNIAKPTSLDIEMAFRIYMGT